MDLDKTEDRVDVLGLAHAGRLYVDDTDGTYWVASDPGTVPAVTAIAEAVGELDACGNLEPGEAGSGPDDLTPIRLTDQGEAFYDLWTT